jgi:hypothetical protein
MLAIGLLGGSTPGVAAQDGSTPPQAPVAFTGHVVCGDQVRESMVQLGAPPIMNRGGAWNPSATMSDPRLEGDYYISFDDDQYVGVPGPDVGAGTWRIENELGAWQGSYTVLALGNRSSVVTTPLAGEGAYEGLTAIWESTYDPVACEWDVWGAIIEGEVPAAPEPFTKP